jgi:ABC-2 type transport system ATP-binding protein
MRAAIETRAVTKAYGESRGIHEVSLAVDQGEVFGFLGPNGAGKTTTIRTLLDLQRPTSGEARIFGLDSRSESAASRARSGNLSGWVDRALRTRSRCAKRACWIRRSGCAWRS